MNRMPETAQVIRCARVLLAAWFSACGTVLAAEDIQISNAWVNEAPPGMRMTAGYLEIANPAAQDLTLTGVTSPDFGNIEFHVTEIRDGVSSMRRRQTISIPAGGVFRFTPGQYHLMLINNTRPLASGDKVPLILTFDRGGPVTIEATVRRADPGAHDHH